MKHTEYVVELRQYNGHGAMAWQRVPDGKVPNLAAAETLRNTLLDEDFPPDTVRIRKVTVTEVYEEVDLGPEKVHVIGQSNAPAIRVHTSAGDLTIRNEKDDLVEQVVIDLPGLSPDHTYQLYIQNDMFYLSVDHAVGEHSLLSRYAHDV